MGEEAIAAAVAAVDKCSITSSLSSSTTSLSSAKKRGISLSSVTSTLSSVLGLDDDKDVDDDDDDVDVDDREDSDYRKSASGSSTTRNLKKKVVGLARRLSVSSNASSTERQSTDSPLKKERSFKKDKKMKIGGKKGGKEEGKVEEDAAGGG